MCEYQLPAARLEPMTRTITETPTDLVVTVTYRAIQHTQQAPLDALPVGTHFARVMDLSRVARDAVIQDAGLTQGTFYTITDEPSTALLGRYLSQERAVAAGRR